MKVAIYARVSTTKDQSCERQILELREIAENHNWKVVGELFFNIINSISQYERDLTAERIKSGLENAKRKGKTLGRKSNLNLETQKIILDMKSQGIGLKKIAKETKVSVQTIRKLLSAQEVYNVATSVKSSVSLRQVA